MLGLKHQSFPEKTFNAYTPEQRCEMSAWACSLFQLSTHFHPYILGLLTSKPSPPCSQPAAPFPQKCPLSLLFCSCDPCLFLGCSSDTAAW